MTTYFIVVIFGAIAATIGPTNMATCNAMVRQATADMDYKFATLKPEEMPPVAGRTVQRSDVFAACYVQDERPRIGERVRIN